MRFGPFVKYWLPVLVWMSFIFIGSGDVLSGQHTSRFLVPFYHFILPWLSSESLDALAFYTRKLGHVTEYAILSLLIWRAIRKPIRKDPRPWSWSLARSTIMLAAFYAATDEFHQSFVPSREARVGDVVIDTIGASLALWLLWLIGRRFRCWGTRDVK